MEPDEDVARLLERAFPGCRIGACQRLSGGISARATAAALVLPDGTAKRVVVRRPARETVGESRLAATVEYALLAHCQDRGVLTPKPYFLDPEAGAVVLEYVEGAPELPRAPSTDMLRQMATALARIHRVPLGDDFAFLKLRVDWAAQTVLNVPAELDEGLDEPGLRSVLRELWPWTQHNANALLHGDYWPGNLLWRDGALVAVLDWEEPDLGDPLADVALTRLDLLWAFGETAMRDFTEYYREQTAIDWTLLPRWELVIALRPMSNLRRWSEAYAPPPINRPDITESHMAAGHRWFVEQALASLGRSRNQ
jgi:aminoglycoside phosphotransferase (APT) family kinase protein